MKMSISVLTLLCVYLLYNALYIKLKLFALYNNNFLWRLVKPKSGFQQPKFVFPKRPVLTSLLKTAKKLMTLSSICTLQLHYHKMGCSNTLMHILWKFYQNLRWSSGKFTKKCLIWHGMTHLLNKQTKNNFRVFNFKLT